MNREIIDNRIEFLRQDGHEDGIALSPKSHRDFLEFIYLIGLEHYSSLTMTDEGMLTTLWYSNSRIGGKSRLTLDFIGDGMIRYTWSYPGESEFGRFSIADSEMINEMAYKIREIEMLNNVQKAQKSEMTNFLAQITPISLFILVIVFLIYLAVGFQ